MKLFEAAISEAETGKKIIDGCVKNAQGNKTVLLFPDDDKELLNAVFKYIDAYLRDYDYAAALSSFDISEITGHTKRGLNLIRLSDIEMRGALRYASMLWISAEQNVSVGSIKIISTRKPYGRQADNLVGFKDITLDKIVVRCLFDIVGELPAR
jgi:hypothetical protein